MILHARKDYQYFPPFSILYLSTYWYLLVNYRRHLKFNANSGYNNLALPYPSVGSAELGLASAAWCRAVPWGGWVAALHWITLHHTALTAGLGVGCVFLSRSGGCSQVYICECAQMQTIWNTPNTPALVPWPDSKQHKYPRWAVCLPGLIGTHLGLMRI